MSATTRRFHSTGDTDDVVGRSRSDVADPTSSLTQRLTRTGDSVGLLIGRLGLGLIMLPHALQKNFGLFGGHGFEGTMGAFTTKMGLPAPIAFLVIVGELACSIALIAGAFTRIAALGVAIIMAGAIATVHLGNGFFMNWYGAKGGEGFEYHLLAIALAVVLMGIGGGRASIDRLLMARRPAAGGGVPTNFVE